MNNSKEKAKCMKSAICEVGMHLTEDDLVNVSGGTDHVVGGTVGFQDITVQNCYNTGCSVFKPIRSSCCYRRR